ncbi:MAG: hypothetical protein LBN07_00925 [Christensenellaceae bacterium]|jgi:glycerophosphoryl diester phosphodiesterase|nr:hypothetical protein [Christensenellaceae bacterium]
MKDLKNSFILNVPIAHRGGFWDNHTIPQQSLKAMEIAIEKGYAIEFDVYVISDGSTVVFHHQLDTHKLTGMDFDILKLKKEDLKNISLCKTDQHPPSLPEVLKLVNGKAPLLVEIKPADYKSIGYNNDKVAKTVYDILKDYKGEFAVQSFDPNIIAWFKNNAPEIMRGLLVSTWSNTDIYRPKNPLVRLATRNMWLFKKANPHFIAHLYDSLPRKLITNKNLPVIGWTIESQSELNKAAPHINNAIFQFFEPDKNTPFKKFTT